MYCVNCGSEIREDSNFCWKCGKPQTSDIQVEEPKWEICEIIFDIAPAEGIFSSTKSLYIAKAVGPKGAYIVGQTPPVDGVEEDEAIDNLIKQLTSDNWEPTGKGEKFWSYKFRRRIN